MSGISPINLRTSVQSAIERWSSPTKPVPPEPTEEPAPPRPQEPTLVPLADGLIVGDQTISSLTLRAFALDGEQNVKDVILIDAMQSGYPGVLRLVESLSGVHYADLDRMTARDFDVTARAVLAHLKDYDDHLKKVRLNYGRPNILIRP